MPVFVGGALPGVGRMTVLGASSGRGASPGRLSLRKEPPWPAPTRLAWGVTAIVLLAAALLPAMRPRDADTTVAGPPRDQAERGEALERDRLGPRGRMR